MVSYTPRTRPIGPDQAVDRPGETGAVLQRPAHGRQGPGRVRMRCAHPEGREAVPRAGIEHLTAEQQQAWRDLRHAGEAYNRAREIEREKAARRVEAIRKCRELGLGDKLIADARAIDRRPAGR